MSHPSIHPALIVVALGFPATVLAQAAATDASVQARLAACDKAVARSAIDEVVRDPNTLKEPLTLFHAALAERMLGRKEEAAFWYLAARLRTGRQVFFEQGDRLQLLAIMGMTVGPSVMPTLEADPDLARRVVNRVIEWDHATPDPFRDRADAMSGEIPEKMAKLKSGLERLPD